MRTVRTQPRDLPARFIKAGDEVAMYETDGEGAAQSRGARFLFARTTRFVEEHPDAVDWFLVVQGPELVAPPAAPDEVPPRVEGRVSNGPGGVWKVIPRDRGFVPDDVDHCGTQRFVIAHIRDNRIGRPVVIYADDHELFIIRERVRVEGHPGGEPVAPGGITRIAEPARIDPDGPAYRAAHVASWRRGTARGHEIAESLRDAKTREALETTAQLPYRRIPFGVLGLAMGRRADASDLSFMYEREPA